MKQTTCYFFAAMCLLSCKTQKTKNLDFGEFTMAVPSSWNKVDLQGTDSYIGGLVTETGDTLTFDMGWYSGDLSRNPPLLVFEKSEYNQFSTERKKKVE